MLPISTEHNTLNNLDMLRTLQEYLNNILGTRPVFPPEHMDVFFVCSGCTKKNINILLWTAVITGNIHMSWWTFQASELHFERLTHQSSVLYAFLVHRIMLIFFFVRRKHTKNTSICAGENVWRCSQSVTFWYSKKCSGHVKII